MSDCWSQEIEEYPLGMLRDEIVRCSGDTYATLQDASQQFYLHAGKLVPPTDQILQEELKDLMEMASYLCDLAQNCNNDSKLFHISTLIKDLVSRMNEFRAQVKEFVELDRNLSTDGEYVSKLRPGYEWATSLLSLQDAERPLHIFVEYVNARRAALIRMEPEEQKKEKPRDAIRGKFDDGLSYTIKEIADITGRTTDIVHSAYKRFESSCSKNSEYFKDLQQAINSKPMNFSGRLAREIGCDAYSRGIRKRKLK